MFENDLGSQGVIDHAAIQNDLQERKMTRRELVLSTAVIAFAANAGGGAVKAENKKTYVLVHGAWHGGWCWRYVKDGLEAAGHRVLSPSLTGLGDRVHLRNPDVNLTTHVNDIVNLFEFEDLSDVVLVGHSYAGHVVSWVTDRVKDRIKQVVYLDAVLPTDGKAFLPPGVGEARIPEAKDGYLMAKPGMDFLGIPEGHMLYDWVGSRLVEHPLPTLMEAVVYDYGGPAGVPKTFVRCTKNPRMASGEADPVAEMVNADSEWDYITLDAGHDLMVTAPKETTEILLGIG